MPLDPNIILAGKTPDIQSPADSIGKVLQLKNLMQQGQQNNIALQQQQLQLQQAQLQQKDQQNIRKAFTDSNNDYSQVVPLAAKYGVSGAGLLNLQKNILDTRAKMATTDEATLKNQATKDNMVAGAIDALKADPSNLATNLPNAVQDLVQRGYLDPKMAQQITVQHLQSQGGGDPIAGLNFYQSQILGHAKLIEDQFKQAEANKNAAQATNFAASTAKTNTELPGVAADALQKQRVAVAPQLAQAQNAQDYAAILNQLPHGVAMSFPQTWDKNTSQKVLQAALTPDQAITTTETARNNQFNNKVSLGHLSVAQAGQDLQNKKFTAEFGTPQSRAQFTDAVKRDPDSFFSLSPQMKESVSRDLVSQGMNVPVQVPSDLKSRAVSAGLTLKAIDNVKQLLSDPDIKGAIGPISGRLGNVEEQVGDTFFAQSDPRAQKEQQLRTALSYLKFQEAKGLFGGRPAAQLIKSLSDTSANTKMSPNLINGALDAMTDSMKRVGQEAKDYSMGGASNAVVGNPSPASAPKAAPKMGDVVSVRGQKVVVTALHPDGTFDAKPVSK